MPTTPAGSDIDLIQVVRDCRLLEPAQSDDLARLQSTFPAPRALAGELVRLGWLTPYQVNQLMQGRGRRLLLGSYVLLERLGAGGMGEVFKARNWKLGQVVALKLIRRERLDGAEAVRRFQREIRAAAQLDHPHVVRAFDADEVGGAHLLVMEYVRGTDLAKLVKKEGPLSVDKACDCARQAALGLQHACERGLVHRDIKPHNLLLTPDGVVKVLDMGLARLDRRTDDGASGTMTREGAVMGTLDYISPEQAMDSHEVDIRSDLYSLGCTLYFLLTGKVPFPGGEALQKLLKHRLDEPEPVERLRRDTPPGVAVVVRKLMAKRPGDRYQTPAEAAEALASALDREGRTRDEEVSGSATQAVTAADGVTAGWSSVADARSADRAVAARRTRRAPPGRPWLWAGAAIGIVVLMLGLAGLFRFLPHGPKPTPPDPPAPPPEITRDESVDAAAAAFNKVVQEVAAMPPEKQAEWVAARLKESNPGFAGWVLPPTVENGAVTGLAFLTDEVADISPLRALTRLKYLTCQGSAWRKGRLSDLSPLEGMKLTYLDCHGTNITDLSPLKGMPLTYLSCGDSPLFDLSPLKGMKLTDLICNGSKVSDLRPLKGMPLTHLQCHYTNVSDLTPLAGMKLQRLICSNTSVSDLTPLKDTDLNALYCQDTPVSDLSPLRGLPLTQLGCEKTAVSELSPLKDMKLKWLFVQGTKVTDFSPLKDVPLEKLDGDFDLKRDADVLRSIRTLETINDRPASEFFTGVEGREAEQFEAWCRVVASLSPETQTRRVAARLRERNAGFNGTVKPTIEHGVVVGLEFVTDDVTDLSPVRALTGLKRLHCPGSASGKGRLADLSPLKGMSLTYVCCSHTAVGDLSPLEGMPLTKVLFTDTNVSDLSPLKGTSLDTLYCDHTRVSDLSAVKGMPLHFLACDFDAKRDAEVLRSIKTLYTINGRAAADVLKTPGDAPPKP